MVKVRLEDMDRLKELIRENNILVYLHNLAIANIDDNISNNKAIEATDMSITLYLLEKQANVTAEINDLINKKDFVC